MDTMEIIDWIALVLVVIGGLNWGLVAFGFNLVNLVLGTIPVLEQAVYVLVAVSAVYVIYKKFAEK